MKLIRNLFISVLTIAVFGLSGEQIFLRDNLSRANVGDFIVTGQNRTYTLLLIADKTPQTILIQEITVPEGRFPPDMPSWRDWVMQGAPGHTGWVAYELEPQSGRLLETFSYTKNSWCDLPSADSFLGTLVNLPLTLMPEQSRRRIGRAPNDGHADRRGVWQPSLVVDGQTVPHASFRAWRTYWPNDGGELAGKQLEIYLPTEEGRYPSYFPYWMQVSGVVGKAKMRIIDSGTALRSPAPPMPRRPLAFTNNGRFERGNLHLWLKTRPYYSDFTLVAIEAGAEKKITPLPFSVRPTEENDTLFFEVPGRVLADKLTPGKAYRFAIQSWKHPNSGAETSDPIRFEPAG